MSVHDAMIDELLLRCKKAELDSSYYVNCLNKILSGEECIAYLFGIGVAPENPTTQIDVMILTHESIIGFNIETNRLLTGRTKRSLYNSVMINKDKTRIQVLLSQGGPLGPGFYINNYLSEEDSVWEFVKTVKQLGLG